MGELEKFSTCRHAACAGAPAAAAFLSVFLMSAMRASVVSIKPAMMLRSAARGG